jgi:L-lactate dehydrogenase
MPIQHDKVAVVGAGAVGATLAYACLIRGVARQVAIYDVNASKVAAETLDLQHGLQFVPMAQVEGSDDVEVCRDAAVIAITAGAKQKVGQSRMDLAAANAGIFRALVPKLMAVAPDAVWMLVTNPVDVMTQMTIKLTGLPAKRVFGSGTVLDSSRFRGLIARRLRVAVQSVHAMIAGEHGDSEVPLWSSATVAGLPLHEWAVAGHGRLTVPERAEIFEGVKTAAARIIEGKGATNYAVGLAGAKILEAVMHNENRVLPVSSLLSDYREGMNGVCMSVPCIVNRQGIDAALKVPLNAAEEAGLRSSAQTIIGALAALGF